MIFLNWLHRRMGEVDVSTIQPPEGGLEEDHVALGRIDDDDTKRLFWLWRKTCEEADAKEKEIGHLVVDHGEQGPAPGSSDHSKFLRLQFERLELKTAGRAVQTIIAHNIMMMLDTAQTQRFMQTGGHLCIGKDWAIILVPPEPSFSLFGRLPKPEPTC